MNEANNMIVLNREICEINRGLLYTYCKLFM